MGASSLSGQMQGLRLRVESQWSREGHLQGVLNDLLQQLKVDSIVFVSNNQREKDAATVMDVLERLDVAYSATSGIVGQLPSRGSLTLIFTFLAADGGSLISSELNRHIEMLTQARRYYLILLCPSEDAFKKHCRGPYRTYVPVTVEAEDLISETSRTFTLVIPPRTNAPTKDEPISKPTHWFSLILSLAVLSMLFLLPLVLRTDWAYADLAIKCPAKTNVTAHHATANATANATATASIQLFSCPSYSFSDDNVCKLSSSCWTLAQTSAPACFVIGLVLVIFGVAALGVETVVSTKGRIRYIAAVFVMVAVVFEISAWGAMISALSSLKSLLCDHISGDVSSCTLVNSSIKAVAYVPLVASVVGVLVALTMLALSLSSTSKHDFSHV